MFKYIFKNFAGGWFVEDLTFLIVLFYGVFFSMTIVGVAYALHLCRGVTRKMNPTGF